MDADVAVISEGPRLSPRPTATLFAPAVAWLAAGDSAHKNIAGCTAFATSKSATFGNGSSRGETTTYL